jgi:hypothetical protein
VRFTEQGQILQEFLVPLFFLGQGPIGGVLSFSVNSATCYGSNYVIQARCRSFNLGNPPAQEGMVNIQTDEYIGFQDYFGQSDPGFGDLSMAGEFVMKITNFPFGNVAAISQSGFTDWQYTGGPPSSAQALCCDNAGFTYFIGSPGANQESVLVKLDSNGKQVWTSQLPQMIDPNTKQPIGVFNFFIDLTWNKGTLYALARTANNTGLQNVYLGRFALRDTDGSVLASDVDVLTIVQGFGIQNGGNMEPWLGRPATWGI